MAEHKDSCLGVRHVWVKILSPLLSSCVSLGKILNHSEL